MKNKLFLGLYTMFLFVLMISAVEAKNSCEKNECDITITINLVAAGGNQETINKWIQDIEDVWNGPVKGNGDSPTYGECRCPVHFEVNFSGFVASCNNTAAGGWHCIEITQGYANDSSGKKYRGYMRGVSGKGSSISGWWSSDHMNKPVTIENTTYELVHDAAHEAGHMLGLGDDYNSTTNTYGNNIMGRTWGDDAKPTQEQINKAVENNCKPEDRECPDECCCANGYIDKHKDEECDPFASPQGCREKEDCGFDCKCIKRPFCGDGNISTEIGEECEPSRKPTGCKEDEECTEECLCEKKEENLSIKITSPSNNTTISGEKSVKTSVISSENVEKVKFYIDEILKYTDYSEPYSWRLDAADYEAGEHILKAVVWSIKGTSAEDSITIITEEAENETEGGNGGGGGGARTCGNGICSVELEENCENCPADCVCETGVCDVTNPLADPFGCYVPYGDIE